MAMRYGHEVVSYVRMHDGSKVPFASMSEEQKQAVRERLVEKISNGIGDYLSAHPEEIEALRQSKSVRFIEERGCEP